MTKDRYLYNHSRRCSENEVCSRIWQPGNSEKSCRPAKIIHCKQRWCDIPTKQERPSQSQWATRFYNRRDPRGFHISNDQLKGQGNKQWQWCWNPAFHFRTDVSTDPVQHSAVRRSGRTTRKPAYLQDYYAKWLNCRCHWTVNYHGQCWLILNHKH